MFNKAAAQFLDAPCPRFLLTTSKTKATEDNAANIFLLYYHFAKIHSSFQITTAERSGS